MRAEALPDPADAGKEYLYLRFGRSELLLMRRDGWTGLGAFYPDVPQVLRIGAAFGAARGVALAAVPGVAVGGRGAQTPDPAPQPTGPAAVGCPGHSLLSRPGGGAICSAVEVHRGVLMMRRRRFLSWGSTRLAVLLLAAVLGFRYLDSRTAEALTRHGRAEVNGKDYPQAIDHFNKAIEIDPKYAPAYDGRGVAYSNQGELDRAIADFDEAIRLDPSDALAWYHRGGAHARAGDDGRALADLAEAIRLDPGSAKAYLARSRVYAKKGDDAQAKADRQKAAELDPSLGKAEDGNR